MRARSASGGRWSVVLPFFNEEAFLGATLISLAAQTRLPDKLILVDNGSTDRSRAVADAFAARHLSIPLLVLDEPTPGKASALQRGVEAVGTEFVATCDADTYYPPAYLETAARLFADGDDVSAALAFGARDARSMVSLLKRAKGAIAAALMPTQAHSGGYGQSFRTSALVDAGGFSPIRWPYCLMDHEIIHRVSRHGRIRHAFDHWCAPSDRRGDRRCVRWRLDEQLLYHLAPRAARDWLFYEHLAGRFAARGVSALRLREKPWTVEGDHAARRSRLSAASEP